MCGPVEHFRSLLQTSSRWHINYNSSIRKSFVETPVLAFDNSRRGFLPKLPSAVLFVA